MSTTSKGLEWAHFTDRTSAGVNGYGRSPAVLLAGLVAMLLAASLAVAPQALAAQGPTYCYETPSLVPRCYRHFYNGKSISVNTNPGVYRTFNTSFADVVDFPAFASDLYDVTGVAKASVNVTLTPPPTLGLTSHFIFEGFGVNGTTSVQTGEDDDPYLGSDRVRLNTVVPFASVHQSYRVAFSPLSGPRPTALLRESVADLKVGAVQSTVKVHERVTLVAPT